MGQDVFCTRKFGEASWWYREEYHVHHEIRQNYLFWWENQASKEYIETNFSILSMKKKVDNFRKIFEWTPSSWKQLKWCHCMNHNYYYCGGTPLNERQAQWMFRMHRITNSFHTFMQCFLSLKLFCFYLFKNLLNSCDCNPERVAQFNIEI